MTLDFAALPPEVNSGRMYAGPGPGPMVAAAAAWDGLAAELTIAARSYRSAISELTGGPWVGPSSATMVAAVTPYLSWMSATAAQAEQTAGQLKSAIAAYEAAFVATVPPPEIEVNRALLAALVATNFLGQNTPAIMATEAQYAEMWAQDAAAMYGYAGASAAATKLIPFGMPPQTTNQGGTAAQAAAVSQAAAAATGPGAQSGLTQAMNLVPAALQGLGSGGSWDPISFVEDVLGTTTGQALNTFTTDTGNWALVISGPLFTASGITPLLGGLYGLAVPQAAGVAGDVAPAAGLGSLAGSVNPGVGGSVAASAGGAGSVGKLSVPQSWASATPGIRLAATATPLPAAGPGGAPQAGPGGFFGGVPPVGSLVNAPRGEETRARTGSGQKVVPTMPGEQGADEAAGRPAPAQPARQHVASALSDREREELGKLRKEIAEAAMERDAAARLIKEAML
ncbi:PPE family protein [Mycobacterium sp. E787]|uniref:PPE family protein n=1 Tax=Mycobacterium sp. E787 TaxID=1834150 RepID=UPI00082D06CF|nr:PPE domain-containing protein [Mycobacterium sp. E787]